MKVIGTTKIAVVLVGLPARGKTYIGRKVYRYLQWLGVSCKVFNVGEYRRKEAGAYSGHEFFDVKNEAAEKIRMQCAVSALEDLVSWLDSIHNGVAIYDATNSTLIRRKMIYDHCEENDIHVMFVESWCDDEELILKNILEVKKTSPDYVGVTNYDEVEKDFKLRISHYKEVYQAVGECPGEKIPELGDYNEANITYVRKINVGVQMVINQIKDYMQSRIVYFLMNIHIIPRSILFSRHGESMYNQLGLLGGDSELSPNGVKYSEALPALVKRIMGDQDFTVWTSTLKRTIQTASKLDYKKVQFKALDEINAGLCDGMTYKQVKQKFPEEYSMRSQNKFEFRYRGGESYRDVVLRLEPIIMELERQQNIMIVSHQAVLRCIYSYFLEVCPEELPYIKIPLHTLMKLTWTAYGCEAQMYSLDIDAVDTHISRPKMGSEKVKSSGEKKTSLEAQVLGEEIFDTDFKESNILEYSTAENSVSPPKKDELSTTKTNLENQCFGAENDENGEIAKLEDGGDQYVIHHTEMLKFPRRKSVKSTLISNIKIPKSRSLRDKLYAMEAQPIVSPDISTSFMGKMAELEEQRSVQNLDIEKRGIMKMKDNPNENKSKKSILSNFYNQKITETESIEQMGIGNITLNKEELEFGANLTIRNVDRSQFIDSKAKKRSDGENQHLGSNLSSMYPTGSIISIQNTPEVTRPGTPLTRETSMKGRASNGNDLKSMRVRIQEGVREDDFNSKLVALDKKLKNEIDTSDVYEYQDKHGEEVNLEWLKISDKKNAGIDIVKRGKKNEKTGIHGTEAASDQDIEDTPESMRSNESGGKVKLSIEKVDQLHLDGYEGAVKVMQTKPALALSFSKRGSDEPDETVVVKQGLTGLQYL
ncbi:hypothetical protein BB559_005108 [Furculomyces boomerangus]|uniref:fructose-2,6-bisphosphate 2-phosphatase n=1 Tax=Furculomyces boomerangus TaxID=61424 RepID=A0A2T9YAQ4_9FUNG|nr:hypothetical protein BB559_005108 [Furculomyces boomerangus]